MGGVRGIKHFPGRSGPSSNSFLSPLEWCRSRPVRLHGLLADVGSRSDDIFVLIFFVVKAHVYTDHIGCFYIFASRSVTIILCKCILVQENMFGNDGRYLRKILGVSELKLQ